MSEETFWFSLSTVIIAGIVAMAIVIGHYNQKTNEKILRATNCEQIAGILGDGNSNRFALCALSNKVGD